MPDKDAQTAYQETYNRLHRSYLERLGHAVETFTDLLTRSRQDCLDEQTLKEAKHLAHGLAGSGATFGFPELSTAGKEIDYRLDMMLAALSPEGACTGRDAEDFRDMMLRLQSVCKKCVDSASGV